MEAEILDMLINTPGLEESDEIVLRCPFRIYEKWGDAAFFCLRDIILKTQSDTVLAKAQIVLEEIGYTADGPPLEFVKEVLEMVENAPVVDQTVRTFIYACVEWDFVWRGEDVEKAVLKLCQLVLDKGLILDKEGKPCTKYGLGSTRYQIRRIERCQEALEMMQSGQLIIPEHVIDDAVSRDLDRKSDRAGLELLPRDRFARAIALSWGIDPAREIKEKRSNCVRITISAPFPLTKQYFRMVDVFWQKENDRVIAKEVVVQ